MNYEVSKEFLLEEVRCDHLVTEEFKKLWAVQMLCVKEIQRICKKHDIKYYAIGGTLLGAVRHKGYIPWDDDIDVGMFKEDYEKFCRVAPTEVKPPFFFQHYTTQEGYGPAMARIRHSETTACTKFEWDSFTEDYNCGIFADVFPIDNVPTGKSKLFFQRLRRGFYMLGIAGYENRRKKKLQGKRIKLSFKQKFSVFFYGFLRIFLNHERLSKKFLKACSACKKSDKVGLVTFCGLKSRYCWKKEYFDDTVELPFEEMTLNAPARYHEMLTDTYGDYNVFVKGAALHTMAIFDAETPYKEKLKAHYEELKAGKK